MGTILSLDRFQAWLKWEISVKNSKETKLMNPFKMLAVASLLATVILAVVASFATAGAIRTDAGFNLFSLAANDDGSAGPITGFPVNVNGTTYTTAYVNNNGNLTRTASSSGFTPFPSLFSSATDPILAPFFADVDTRGAGSGIVRYGASTVAGHLAAGVNWINVGYFNGKITPLNSFQLVIIQRSDINPGDFDFEFNYDHILWETGDSNGGVNGLGGSSARAGWSDGAGHWFEIPGAGVNGAYLDSNLSTGLIHNSLNSDVLGRYLFQVRSGVIEGAVPEPSTMVLACLAAAGLAVPSLRRRRQCKPEGHIVRNHR